MKSFYLLTFVIACLSLSLISCQNGDSDKIRNEARQSLPQPPANDVTAAPTTTPTPAATNSNEPHYKCPNNCAGGTSDAAGSCSVCGTTLAHNQAYHNNPQPANPTINPASPTTTPTTTPQPPAAAQNAAGVYHYTCSAGCAGGAGSAGTCATCGGALAHNPAYHN